MEVYSPIISLGGRLTSMHKEKPVGIFKIWSTNWRGALLRACGK